MHFLSFAVLTAAVTASALEDNLHKRSNCAALAKTTTTIAGAAATLVGPFDLAASAPGEPYDGKLAISQPPDGSCCSNFFIFGIPPSRASTNAASFFLNGDQLVSIQDGALWTAYDGGTDDPINSHVLLGNGGDLTSNPVLSCSVDESCALTCSAPGGYAYNCLASPGYQPDWRLATSKSVAGPGCVEFNPVVIPVSGSAANNGGIGLPSGAVPVSASASVSSTVSSSSAVVSSSSSSGSKKDTTKTMVNTLTSGGNGGPAGASSSAAAMATGNMALPTAAPAILANAAIAVGILAAL